MLATAQLIHIAGMIGLLLVASIGALLIWLNFRIVTVNGYSMRPTFEHGERVVVYCGWGAARLQHGDIILSDVPALADSTAASSKATPVIKRVTGLPGDIINVHVQDLPPVLQQAFRRHIGTARTWHVPPHYYYLTCDGEGISSHLWGPVHRRHFIGRVVGKLPGKADLPDDHLYDMAADRSVRPQ